MARYSIEAVQYGSERWIEVCQVNANPEMIKEGLENKKLRITMSDGRHSTIAKYTRVRIVDHDIVDYDRRSRELSNND
jgi:hypothetical protein